MSIALKVSHSTGIIATTPYTSATSRPFKKMLPVRIFLYLSQNHFNAILRTKGCAKYIQSTLPAGLNTGLRYSDDKFGKK
jgi:hypothetical protein